ncbi:MAG: dihydroorotate dehydrogenase-like protein [Bacteroidales bacterium]|nr:dihydroorotate dehydrogenase-like protein [Bacteroidales bacterium]
MKDLTTKYIGLTLANPVIAASSGLTASVESIQTLEKNGAAAVVLKSIFEEEILLEVNQQLEEAKKNPIIYSGLSETLDYIDLHIREDSLNDYLNLIRDAKNAVSIPVIASINCVSFEDWTYFTKKIEEADADALELNLFMNPADFQNKEFEKTYFRIIEKVLATVEIPVAIKISKYFTRMGLSVKALSESGVSGIVMFNRFYTPDIDLDTISLSNGKLFTTAEDLPETLRWIAIMSNKVNCDLAASTGIHSGDDVIKMLLAGASATQVASTLYKNGPGQITRILNRVEKWMDEKGFDSIDQFRGKVSGEYSDNPASFERMQFMKHFSEIR